MMKRMAIVGATLAAVASVACGAQLINIAPLSTATNAASVAACLSQDGLYVGGRTTDPYDNNYTAGYYNLSTSTWTTVVNGTTPNSGVITGVAHVSGGTFLASGNMNDTGNRVYTTANQFGKYTTNGSNGSSFFAPSSETMVGNANLKTYPMDAASSARSNAAGTDSWITGSHAQGTNGKGNQEGYIWKSSTGATAYTTILGRNNTRVTMVSVSSTGRAVGYDAYTASQTAGYVDATSGTTTLKAVGLVPGYDSTGASFAWGISENGDYITGYQKTTSTTRPQGFVWKVGTQNATLLPDINGNVNDNSCQGYPVAVADDGCAVGYGYYASASPTNWATIWLPGATKAQKLADLAAAQGINLTGWNLGNTATAIEKIGNHYYVSGTGSYTSNGTNYYTRGYVLVLDVPEPATMGLLALGGVAMLRRRR